MMNGILKCGVGAMLLASTPLLAAPDVRLEPASKWNAHYAEDSCQLLREFGDKANPVALRFVKFSPGDQFELSMSGNSLRKVSNAGSTDFQFGPNEQVQRLEYLPGTVGEKIRAIFLKGSMRIAPFSKAEEAVWVKMTAQNWSAIAPIGSERAAAVKELLFGTKGRGQMTFVLGSMKAPFAALDTCLEKLLETWGVDVAKQKAATRPALPLTSPGTWLSSSDYPTDAVFSGEQGLINFRLSVDATGKSTACHIQLSTRSKSFDDIVCRAMMRKAKFSPALDANGQAFPSYFRSRVLFVMPY